MSYYDEVEIEDMEFDEETGTYYYPCPCGDVFQITLEELAEGCELGKCPSCSLVIRVIYDPEDFKNIEEEEEEQIEVEQEMEEA
jgi:diphthamide biosynthesis protein 3